MINQSSATITRIHVPHSISRGHCDNIRMTIQVEVSYSNMTSYIIIPVIWHWTLHHH